MYIPQKYPFETATAGAARGALALPATPSLTIALAERPTTGTTIGEATVRAQRAFVVMPRREPRRPRNPHGFE